MQPALRRGLATLLAATLDDGERRFEPVGQGRFYYLEGGGRASRPDWMAAVRVELPPALELEEGDF